MLMAPQNLPENFAKVRERIAAACRECGRNTDSITLLAVSKGQPAQMIEAAVTAGISDIGESYLQEALAKLDALAHLRATWHFIGRIQANKTRLVAERFAWVHSIDRLHILERLSAQRPFHAPPLNVCLQVNVAGETSKGGVPPHALRELAVAASQLPRIRLRGLMCIPPEETDFERQRPWFSLLRQQLESLGSVAMDLDTLSMGMSSDLEAAICEGSTLLRVGTALFGPRPREKPVQSGPA
jgi:PLP dependent protein